MPMSKKHHKHKNRAKGKARAEENSALGDLAERIHAMEDRIRRMAENRIKIGWVDGKKESPRSKPTKIRKGRLKGRMSHVKYGADFVGPMETSPTLAVIARTLCYGREKGVTKNGHEYGRIPPRNFVKVFEAKFTKPILHCIRDTTGIADIRNRSHFPNQAGQLQAIGVVAKGQFQRAMLDSNAYAPNAPATVAAKGSARPLVDTKTLINSVDFEIVENGK